MGSTLKNQKQNRGDRAGYIGKRTHFPLQKRPSRGREKEKLEEIS